MADKQQDNTAFETLRKTIESECPNGSRFDKLYFFYGEERYMLDYYLSKLREKLVGGDFFDFNYRKFSGGGWGLDQVAAACQALPVFSERTLVEVHDFDILKAGADAREKLGELIAELPEETCLIFVSPSEDFEKDEWPKLKKALGKDAHFVPFNVQDKSKLVKWIRRHFQEHGKSLDAATAEYLAFVTGGTMLSLKSEIEKLSFYVKGETVTREAIDQLVTPTLDAQHWTLTDHITAGRFDSAAAVLSDLFGMQEVPHKLMFTVSLKLRQLLLARLMLDSGQDTKQLMKTAGINFEFQARNLMNAARRLPLEQCRRYVLLAAEAAYQMNSGSDPEAVLTELLIRLADTARTRAS